MLDLENPKFFWVSVPSEWLWSYVSTNDFTVNSFTWCASYCTIFPDNAVCSGLGSCVIRHSHSVHTAVRSAVSINLKCCLLLLHVRTDFWPHTSTLEAFAWACGQCHSHGRDSSFGLSFPGYHGDLFKWSMLDLGFQNQPEVRDYMHGLLIEDVHWHTLEPTWHWGQRLDHLLLHAHHQCLVFQLTCLMQNVFLFSWPGRPKVFHIHQFWPFSLWRVCIIWAELEANKTNTGIILHLCPLHVLYEYVWLLSVKQCQAMIYSAWQACLMWYPSNHINILKSMSKL